MCVYVCIYLLACMARKRCTPSLSTLRLVLALVLLSFTCLSSSRVRSKSTILCTATRTCGHNNTCTSYMKSGALRRMRARSHREKTPGVVPSCVWSKCSNIYIPVGPRDGRPLSLSMKLHEKTDSLLNIRRRGNTRNALLYRVAVFMRIYLPTAPSYTHWPPRLAYLSRR